MQIKENSISQKSINEISKPIQNIQIKERIRNYLIGVVELIVHEAGDDAGFTHRLIAKEYELVFGQRRHRRHFSESLASKSGLKMAKLDLNLRKSL